MLGFDRMIIIGPLLTFDGSCHRIRGGLTEDVSVSAWERCCCASWLQQHDGGGADSLRHADVSCWRRWVQFDNQAHFCSYYHLWSLSYLLVRLFRKVPFTFSVNRVRRNGHRSSNGHSRISQGESSYSCFRWNCNVVYLQRGVIFRSLVYFYAQTMTWLADGALSVPEWMWNSPTLVSPTNK